MHKCCLARYTCPQDLPHSQNTVGRRRSAQVAHTHAINTRAALALGCPKENSRKRLEGRAGGDSRGGRDNKGLGEEGT